MLTTMCHTCTELSQQHVLPVHDKAPCHARYITLSKCTFTCNPKTTRCPNNRLHLPHKEPKNLGKPDSTWQVDDLNIVTDQLQCTQHGTVASWSFYTRISSSTCHSKRLDTALQQSASTPYRAASCHIWSAASVPMVSETTKWS